jgi:hypothetical protein
LSKSKERKKTNQESSSFFFQHFSTCAEIHFVGSRPPRLWRNKKPKKKK